MNSRVALIFILLTGLLCQCNSHQDFDDDESDYPSRETFKSIDSCMSFMNTDPQKAHQMLDSLLSAGLMTTPRCDYFHAIVVYNGENELDSALSICNRLLDEGNFGNDPYLEEEICELASNITSSNARHLETLKYASRGIAICHGNENMRSDEAILMARVGVAEQGLGRIQQAQETFARAYNILKENSSFGDLVAMISLQKKQAGLYFEAKEYDDVIRICREILSLVERFDRDPSFIAQRPETMQESGDATHDFADFYQSQIYSLMASAYRMMIEQGLSTDVAADTEIVKACIAKWSATNSSHSTTSLAATIHELYFTGRKAEFAEAKKKVAELYQGDSILVEYANFLKLLSEEAAANHDLKASNSYLKRALIVSDSIRHKDLARKLTEQMSLNMVQEQQLARQDAERQLERHKLLIMLESIIIAIMLIAGLVIAFLWRKNIEKEHILEITQHDLYESKEEIEDLVQQLEDSKAEKVVLNTEALYQRIAEIMEANKPYLNPTFDIQYLAEEVNSSRSQVSSCINTVTGKPFRVWLSEYRLSLFDRKLRENPGQSVDTLFQACGYKEQSTFRRQFKAAYGVTAGEYRKALLKSHGNKIEEE